MLSPKRVWKAFTYTSKGLRSAWKTEAAFRDEVILVVMAQALCLWLQPVFWLWLIFIFGNCVMLLTELLNTGLEYIVDHISLEQHPLLGSAKDVGSAAVFMMLAFNGGLLAYIIYQHWAH